ncbi:MAG: hypothetical protein JW901_05460 [Dehalococcoidia bacterium]|nr:hypothetical protein [Dehalococcoidia bacterium]
MTPAPHFTDEELQVFLTLEGSVNLAAAAALEAWAASFSESATSETIGDYSYSKKSVQNKLELAQKLRDKENNTPAMGWSEMDLETFGENTGEGLET